MRCLVTLTVLGALASGAQADHETLQVSGAWARATPPGHDIGAVYFVLTSHVHDPIRLIGIDTPIAERAELHGHSQSDGVMMMRALAAIEVGPDEPAVLAAGGTHVMLQGLVGPLVAGKVFPLTLVFESGASVALEVEILPIDAMVGSEKTERLTIRHADDD